MHDEAVAYFTQQQGLHRLILCLAQRYRKHGEFKGVITLQSISDAEALAMNRWFRVMDFSVGQSIRISCQKFMQAWQKTRFQDLDLRAVLESYLQEELRPQAEKTQSALAARENLLSELQSMCTSKLWLDLLEGFWTKSPELQSYQRFANESLEEFTETMAKLALVLRELPHKEELLPIFSNRVLGDPHALDSDQALGRLLLAAIRYHLRTGYSAEAIRKLTDHDLLRSCLLIRDDVLNLVSAYGLIIESEISVSPHWTISAFEQRSFVNLTLEELNRTSRARSAGGGPILILENSGVFSQLVKDIRLFQSQGGPFPSALICFHGQLKQASWRLLDLLAASDNIDQNIFYAGDLDEDGIRIADRILLEAKGRVTLSHMNRETYLEYLPTQPGPERSLNLEADNLVDRGLRELAQQLKITKKPIFQETFIPLYKKLLGIIS